MARKTHGLKSNEKVRQMAWLLPVRGRSGELPTCARKRHWISRPAFAPPADTGLPPVSCPRPNGLNDPFETGRASGGTEGGHGLTRYWLPPLRHCSCLGDCLAVN